jgi:hypothetical protein
VTELGETVTAEFRSERCATEYVQVSSEAIRSFDAYSVLGASQRYLVVSGEGSFAHIRFSSQGIDCVPEFSIQGFLSALR